MKVNKKALERLFHYRNILYRLQEDGVTRIYSDTLAEELHTTASQVRKDFSLFHIKGNKKAGYHIPDLLDRLEEIFDSGAAQKVIIMGMGRIGSALAQYRWSSNQNLVVVAGFDIDPAKQQRTGFPVYDPQELSRFVSQNSIELGILAVPERVAQAAYDALAKAGIRGVLNFAPVILTERPGCVVTSYCVESELSSLIYIVNKEKKEL
ncbi:redox-sensing transcriptional repressor Rex [Chitinivibrio alkaliphilus ACht1]|uniref:Redox-sensing transcriptional repressor Rex n=2 Tax=Chitinivibrio TaxID=1505231 RepID=U7DB41_9BACT|nr:redox-sensing transcriptional repressor Rex [Chitinivibrio alkaliphilus ACht1]